MSISRVFYALIEDKCVVFQEAEFQPDYVIFRGRLRQSAKKCPCCNTSNVRVKETKERTFRMLNFGQRGPTLRWNPIKSAVNGVAQQAGFNYPLPVESYQ